MILAENSPNHVSPVEPEMTPAPEVDSPVIEILVVLLRHKKMISAVATLITCLATLAIFLWPPSYVAQAVILPPQQGQSSMAALASGAMGGMASSMGSQLGLKNPADLYIGILKSRTIADDIIDEFHLQSVYEKKFLSSARKKLKSRATFVSSKEMLITISVEDRDPARATAMANAFVASLYKQNSRLALTGAAQKRLFFDQQLAVEKDALAKAEIDLKATQQSTGLVVPTGQAEVLIRSGALLRAEIASHEVQLQAMRGYATDENPQMKTLKTEISALQGQLAQVEASGSPGSKMEMSGSRLPQATLEYIRKLREVKYHETLFELIAKQYEVARIDEAKEAPLIQVVDRAVVPDKPDGPGRVLLLLGAVVAGLVLGSLSALASETFGKFRAGLKTALQMKATF
jgi:tyrosine-protein kinase Etk/Wzc